MKTYVFEGHSVSGKDEAIDKLSELLTRLKAFEHVFKSFPGYPSLIAMGEKVKGKVGK